MDELDKPSSLIWHIGFIVSIIAAIIMLLLDLTQEACIVLIFSGMSTFIISLEEAVVGNKGRLVLIFCGYGFYLLTIIASIIHALSGTDCMQILVFPWLAAGLMCFVALSIWVLIKSIK